MFIWKNTKLRCNPFAKYIDENGAMHTNVPPHLYEEIADPQPPEGFTANPDHYFVTEQDDAPYVVWTRKSDEQIVEIELAKAKQARAAAVEKIVITTTAGNTFDGDERSQDRMARAVAVMDDADELPWVLADNSITTVSKAEIREALRLAGLATAAEWVKPYVG